MFQFPGNFDTRTSPRPHSRTLLLNCRLQVYWWTRVLDAEGWSQKATLVVVLLVVVFSSLKIPKAFLIRSGAQRNFAYSFVLIFPTDLLSQIFSWRNAIISMIKVLFICYRFKIWHWTFTKRAALSQRPAAARCAVERSDEYLCTGGAYRRPIEE